MKRALCILLLAPSLALADYKSDYRDGVAAAERQDWARVDALMRKAMAEEPEPQARIRLYGQVFVPYVPKFYLGLAAFNRKDCTTAISLLEDSRNASVIRGQRLEERQQMMLRSCRAQLAKAATPVPAPAPAQPAPATPVPTPAPPKPVASAPVPAAATPAPPPLATFDTARAQALQARLDRVDAAIANSTRVLGDAALADSRANWQRQLEPLGGQLRQARGSLNSARQSRDAAGLSAVERTLATLEASADKVAQGINSARMRNREVALADARSALERMLGQGERQLAQAGDGKSREAQALAQALTQGRANLAASDAARLQGAVQAIEAAGRALEAAQARQALAAQVRGRLQPLAEAYLGGDFLRAAQWADEQSLRSVPQAHAEALLLRAAARFELYVLGGEQDLAQFDLIRNDVRTARRVSASTQPSEKAYSPRFRALFASTR